MLQFDFQHLADAALRQHGEHLVERNDLTGLQRASRPVMAVLVGHRRREGHAQKDEAGEDAHDRDPRQGEVTKRPIMRRCV